MNVDGTMLAILPIELQDLIFEMATKSKMESVLKDLKFQILEEHTKYTKHSNLTQHLLYRHNLFEDLWEWIEVLEYDNNIDSDSYERIICMIQKSSPYFIYIEDLTYQELIAFKAFIV